MSIAWPLLRVGVRWEEEEEEEEVEEEEEEEEEELSTRPTLPYT